MTSYADDGVTGVSLGVVTGAAPRSGSTGISAGILAGVEALLVGSDGAGSGLSPPSGPSHATIVNKNPAVSNRVLVRIVSSPLDPAEPLYAEFAAEPTRLLDEAGRSGYEK